MGEGGGTAPMPGGLETEAAPSRSKWEKELEPPKFARISLEDFAVLDVDRKPEHHPKGRITIKSGIWNQNTLHIRYMSESRIITLQESSGIKAIDPNSRENFLSAANTFLEGHDMYLVNACYTPASLWNLWHHKVEGDLHQRSSRYANLLGWEH